MLRILTLALLLSCHITAEDIFKTYHNNDQLDHFISNLNSKFIETRVLAKTPKGNSINCITISSGKGKPAILLIGDTNSSPTGSQILISWINSFVNNEQAIQELTKDYDIFIIPRPFPDSLDSFFGKVKFESAVNSTPVDNDNDLAINEDGFEDLNNDGFISLLRIKDEEGTHVEHEDSSYLMIPKKDSKKQSYKIISEGIDNDKDEVFNEDPPGGVNPNRNFSFNYPYFKKDAGIHQMSEIESRTIAEFCFANPQITLIFSFGNEDNLAAPWKENAQKAKESIRSTIYKNDEQIFKLYSESYKEHIKAAKGHSGKAEISGSLAHWAYYHFGRISLTARAWKVPTHEIEDKLPEEVKEVKWLEKNRPNALLKWQKIQHPDFPDKEVEIGGILPHFRNTPDQKSLAEINEKFFKFFKSLTTEKPDLQVKELQREKLSDTLSRITLKIINKGSLPIRSTIGEKSKKVAPLNVHLILPKDWSTYNCHPRLQIGNLKSGESKEISWVVITNKEDKEFSVKFHCPQIRNFEVKAEAQK